MSPTTREPCPPGGCLAGYPDGRCQAHRPPYPAIVCANARRDPAAWIPAIRRATEALDRPRTEPPPPRPSAPGGPPPPDMAAAIHDARLGRFVRACPHRGAVGDCRGTARCKLGLRGTAACGHVSPADCKRLCGASLWAASRGLPAPSI